LGTIHTLRRRDWLDALPDGYVSHLAMQSVEDDPYIIDLIGEDATLEEQWFALLEEDLIRVAREEADQIALIIVCAPELIWSDILE